MRTWTMGTLIAALSGLVFGSPFTYQGVLEDGGAPADGMYDMRFTLADAPVLGLALQVIVIDDVVVSDGLFEVELDYLDSHFDGSDRWLGIQVDGSFLNPRTKINYAPYAIRAARASIANTVEVPLFVSATNATINAHATSSTGTALLGWHTDTSGTAAGIHGRTNSVSSSAIGVHGEVTSTIPGGFSTGVLGENNGTGFSGIGVTGTHAGSGWGVYGDTPTGWGVYGRSDSGTGVRGFTTTGVGVNASNSDADTTASMATEHYGLEAFNMETQGEGTAIYGEGGRVGVYGTANPDGFGSDLTRIGVQGFAGGFSTGANMIYGMYGFGANPIEGGLRTAYGVYGLAQVGNQGNTAYGIYGESVGPGSNQWAGYFSGDVHVAGTLSKSSGSFKIDHPMDPENMYLSHSFIESPDMMNVYNGVVVLDGSGSASVELPDYFESLNRSYRYQLTAVGASMPGLHIAYEVSANQFGISGGAAGGKVSWQVTGVRMDPAAVENPIVVEQKKDARHRGLYLNPEAYGFGDEKAIHPSGRQN